MRAIREEEEEEEEEEEGVVVVMVVVVEGVIKGQAKGGAGKLAVHHTPPGIFSDGSSAGCHAMPCIVVIAAAAAAAAAAVGVGVGVVVAAAAAAAAVGTVVVGTVVVGVLVALAVIRSISALLCHAMLYTLLYRLIGSRWCRSL